MEFVRFITVTFLFLVLFSLDNIARQKKKNPAKQVLVTDTLISAPDTTAQVKENILPPADTIHEAP
jgi:hypothetical protein